MYVLLDLSMECQQVYICAFFAFGVFCFLLVLHLNCSSSSKTKRQSQKLGKLFCSRERNLSGADNRNTSYLQPNNLYFRVHSFQTSHEIFCRQISLSFCFNSLTTIHDIVLRFVSFKIPNTLRGCTYNYLNPLPYHKPYSYDVRTPLVMFFFS